MASTNRIRASVVFVAVAAVGLSSCGPTPNQSAGSGVAITNVTAARSDDFPPPVKPVWMTAADMERLVKPLESDSAKREAFFDDLDFFVLMASAGKSEEQEKSKAAAVLTVKYFLHKLFYAVSFEKTSHPSEDPDFYHALATFERRAGLKVDGRFTVNESSRLQYLASLEGEPQIRTIFKLVNGSGTYASAEGTWVIQGERIAYPVNRAQIQCWRSDRTCVVYTANVSMPEGRQSDIGGPLLMTDVEHYDVAEWGAVEVRARTTTICRQIILTVNWAAKQAFTVATDLSKEGCPTLGPLTKPRVTTLEGGDAIEAFFKTRQELVQTVSNSPLERVRSLFAQARPTPNPAPAAKTP